MEYLITFIEGIASFISPCILPMIPMYISYFATQDKSIKNTLLNSMGFVLGFTIIFVILGIFAGTLGMIISKYSFYINIILGIILILLGLNYIGVINIKILNKTKGNNQDNKYLSFLKAVLFGMIFSISWTPCVGAFLGSALIMAATYGSIVKGVILLLTYSIGLGIPFIITAIFIEKLKQTFDFIKKNYRIINKIAGGILLVTGILIMFGLNTTIMKIFS